VDQTADARPPADAHDTGRLLGFSDAVVAIAATLLVLPLLDIVRDRTSEEEIGAILRQNRSAFFAFVLSFVVIYRFWLVHHMIFARVRESAACLWLVRRSGGEHTPASQTRVLIITGAMALAFVLAATVPGAGPWALLLLFPAVALQRIAVPRRIRPWMARLRNRSGAS
jgi:hypothetical protein